MSPIDAREIVLEWCRVSPKLRMRLERAWAADEAAGRTGGIWSIPIPDAEIAGMMAAVQRLPDGAGAAALEQALTPYLVDAERVYRALGV